MSVPRRSPADEAFTESLLREAGWTRALARRLVRDDADADDAAQGALTLALERRPRDDASLRPWLARVVVRLVRRGARTSARRADRERRVAGAVDPAAATDAQLERLELSQALADRVRALPEPYRGVVLRRYYDGCSAAEIARAIGVPAATVRSQLARALERLRRDLDERDGTKFSGGALAPLLLLAAGPPGGPLARASAELIAMKTSTKFAATSALLAASLLVVAVRTVPHAPRNAESRGAETDLVMPRDTEPPPLARVADESIRAAAGTRSVRDPESARAGRPAASEDGPVTTVRARLVDERDRPVEGAVLRSVRRDGSPRGADAFGISDADGAVAVEIDDGDLSAYGARVFPMAFRATAPLRATAFAVSTPRRHGETELGDLVLGAGGALRGLLVDSAGAPLAGRVFVVGEAVVEEVERLRLTGPEPGDLRPRADAAADGRFEFPGVAVGRLRLVAGAEGRLWTVTEPIDVAQGATVDTGRIVLDDVPAEERIAGVVLGPDGAPAGGARVSHATDGTEEGTLVADAEGRFVHYPGGPGRVEFIARHVGDALAPSPPVVASRGDNDVVLRLRPRQEIAVTIVGEDGEPIAGAAVLPIVLDRASFAGGGRTLPGADWRHAGDNGVVWLPVPPIEFEVATSRSGYEALRLGPFATERAPATLEVVLRHQPVVAGRVTSADGPVAGATVRIGQRIPDFVPLEAGFPQRHFFGTRATAEADESGRFAISVTEAWTDVSVLAHADGLAAGETELTLVPGEGAEGVVVELTEGGVVEGRVVPPAGTPVQDLYVAASRGDGRPEWSRPDADGTYRLERLAPGPWRVEGRLHEPTAAVLSVANDPADKMFRWNVNVVDGETARLDLDMRGKGRVEFHGRLVVDGGAPPDGWRVSVQRVADLHTGRAAPAVDIDASGAFVLDVPAGRCTLQIVGRLEGNVRVELFRDLELEGTRVDREVEITTGPVAARVEDGGEEVRVIRGGASYRGDRDAAYFEPDAEGRIEGRAPAGAAFIEVRRPSNIGSIWVRVRAIDVRADRAP